MADDIHEGGCLCGAVSYRITGAALWVAHCHCRSCRRQTGSVLASFVGVLKPQFAILRGSPRRRESSPGVWRRHCAECGTPLTYESERVDDETHVFLGSLDEPGAFRPQRHVFTEEAVPWLKLDDGLPRHARLSRE
jgi:hypothetical protein